MEFILLLLFLVSLPVFWVWGLISFIRQLSSSKSSPKLDESPLLQDIISDLTKLKNKNETVVQLIEKYKFRLALNKKLNQPESYTSTPDEVVPQNPPTIPASVVTTNEITKANIVTQDVNDWWDRWYQENNINLLLYIGAFLIVSSAAIFVGFNWASFSGVFKALVLTVITLAFFGSGFFFYKKMPKLKNAGATFIAIGSLLIPFNGLAWYNFYLRDLGVSFGFTWLLTSILAVSAYFFLAYFVRNRFYTYIAGLGGLSLIEALVNVSSLNSQFYILGGIFSAFALLGGSKLVADTRKKEFDEIYSQPLQVSSNIVMPIFLIWGLLASYSMGRLFTAEVSISTFLASAYYSLSYLISKNITIFVLGELLLTLATVITTKTLGFSGAPIFLVIFSLSLLYQIIGYYLKSGNKLQESYYSFFVSMFTALLALSIAFVDPLVSPEQRVYFSLIVACLSFLASYLERTPTYLYIAFGILDLAAFYQVYAVIQQTEFYKYLGVFYSVLGSFVYIASEFYSSKKSISAVLKNIAYLNIILAIIFAFSSASFLAIVALVVFACATLSHYFFTPNTGYYNYVASISISTVALLVALVDPSISVDKRVIFSIVTIVISLLATYLEQQPFYLYPTIVGLDIATYQVIFHNFNLVEPLRALGLSYLGLGAILFVTSLVYWKIKQSWSEIILQLSGLNLALAVVITFAYPGLSLTTTLTILVIGLVASYFFQKREYIYLAVLFAIFSTYNILRLTNSPVDYYPFAFVALGYITYLVHLIELPKDFRDTFRQSGLYITSLTPAIFGFYAFTNQYFTQSSIELNSLISAYIATGLLTFEALIYKKGSVGYIASAFGLATILWQLKYLSVHETQAYTVTTGLYFLALAYVKRGQSKEEDRKLFDYIGLATLIGPLTLQAFPGESGFWYALLLGFEGLILILAGFSLNYKTYTYAGSAAIAIATLTRLYSFITSLPSWATVGLGGLIFLGSAIYLLSRRKVES